MYSCPISTRNIDTRVMVNRDFVLGADDLCRDKRTGHASFPWRELRSPQGDRVVVETKRNLANHIVICLLQSFETAFCTHRIISLIGESQRFFS